LDSSPVRVDRWNATHWLFDYEVGFIKRGLVGSCYQHLGLPHTPQSILLVSVLLAGTASVIWAIYLVRSLDETNLDFAGFPFVVWAVTMPGSVQQYFYDLGRFDAFGAIAILFGLAALNARTTPRRSLVVITCLGVVSILVHEAYYLWVVPTLLGAWLFTTELDRENWIALGVALLVLTGLVLYVGRATAADHVARENFTRYLASKGDILPHPNSVAVQFRSLGESINYGLRRGFTSGRFLGALLCLVSCWPALVTARQTLARLAEESSRRWWQWAACLAAAALPLSLYLVGHDHGRWWAMSAFSLTALLPVLTIDGHETILRDSLDAARGWLILGIVSNLVLGPYGITSPFPLFRPF
jgi:hypothetical protein